MVSERGEVYVIVSKVREVYVRTIRYSYKTRMRLDYSLAGTHSVVLPAPRTQSSTVPATRRYPR